MSNEFNLAAIPQTAIKVITQPAVFFREMPKKGGFVEPLIFALVLGLVSGVINTLVLAVKMFSVMGMMVLSSLVLAPIFITIGCFIGAAIFFVIWKLMGSQEDYETAFRCAAYITAVSPITAILNIIPYIGAILGIVLMLYYIVKATVEVHAIAEKKAWLVFGIIAAVLCLLSMCSILAGRYAARGLDKATQNYLDQSTKMMQQQTEMMKQQAQQAQQMQGQQGQPTPEQLQKQIEEAQKMMEQMQKQQAAK